MTITKLLTPIALVATIAVTATPAQAGQHRGGGSRGSAPSGGFHRGGPGGGPRAVPRARAYPSYRGHVYGGPRIVGPRGYIGGPRFYRPYYSFRPRLSLGFGLWLGYPVPYPYYGYSYPYPPDPYAYGYAAPTYGAPSQPYPDDQYSSNDRTDPDDQPDQGYSTQQPGPSVGVQQGNQAAPGGVSFEITPETAAVFVDGTYVGTAADFSPTSSPLGLIPGRHHVEIRASGYRTMTFDADVTTGQVLPYKGTLQQN